MKNFFASVKQWWRAYKSWALIVLLCANVAMAIWNHNTTAALGWAMATWFAWLLNRAQSRLTKQYFDALSVAIQAELNQRKS